MTLRQLKNEFAIRDLGLCKGCQAGARNVGAVLQDFTRKTCSVEMRKRLHLDRMLVCLCLQEFFCFGFRSLGLIQAHTEKMLLGV
ncbi:hypothetical protein EV658_1371 [Phaeovulum veldkampii DSM 11550]|nr:hypothetical protein EV658_1371 [Phaeovulum veldkampii DSM 11550]